MNDCLMPCVFLCCVICSCFQIFHNLDDQLHGTVHAKDRTVQTEIIAVRASPFLGGIIIVIALALAYPS